MKSFICLMLVGLFCATGCYRPYGRGYERNYHYGWDRPIHSEHVR
jgi:hypothetical protein